MRSHVRHAVLAVLAGCSSGKDNTVRTGTASVSMLPGFPTVHSSVLDPGTHGEADVQLYAQMPGTPAPGTEGDSECACACVVNLNQIGGITIYDDPSAATGRTYLFTADAGDAAVADFFLSNDGGVWYASSGSVTVSAGSRSEFKGTFQAAFTGDAGTNALSVQGSFDAPSCAR